MQWRCDVCGHVHTGDSPPDVCPVCGVGPDFFTPLGVSGPPDALEPGPAGEGGTRWRCVVCGHVHTGDEPPDVCPLCGVDRSFFEREGGEVAPPLPAPTGPRIAIIGGGAAGLAAAEAARKANPAARIAILGREPGLPYNRLELTRVLAGLTGVHQLELKPAEWFAAKRVEVVRAHVRSADLDARLLHLGDGTTWAFDRLVLATGAHPFVPPWPGVTRDGVQPLRTLEQARALLERAREGSSVTVIGGGLLGLEAAGALAGRGVHVTVLESFPSLLGRQLPPRGGAILQEHLEALGIAVRCGVAVAEILGDEAASAVLLDGGDRIEADAVVVSTGIRSSVDLARRAGLEVDRGVVVDARMRTSHPRVWAAGDVAEIDGLVYGLWGAAWLQGQVAGANAAGADLTFQRPPPSTRLKVLDVEVVWGGTISGEGIALREAEDGGSYQALAVRGGVLVGYSLLGDATRAGELQSSIGQPLST